MPTSAFLADLKKEHDAYESARRALGAASAKIQHAAKRAIFALQRDDEAGAKALLSEAEEALEGARAALTDSRLAQEGPYRAALEEYAEARFFLQMALKGSVAPIGGLDEETQIGGLCDALGEVVRLMVVRAAARRFKEVEALKRAADEVYAGIAAMDFGGYLRTKADQARSHLRRAEDVLYEVSLHGKD